MAPSCCLRTRTRQVCTHVQQGAKLPLHHHPAQSHSSADCTEDYVAALTAPEKKNRIQQHVLHVVRRIKAGSTPAEYTAAGVRLQVQGCMWKPQAWYRDATPRAAPVCNTHHTGAAQACDATRLRERTTYKTTLKAVLLLPLASPLSMAPHHMCQPSCTQPGVLPGVTTHAPLLLAS